MTKIKYTMVKMTFTMTRQILTLIITHLMKVRRLQCARDMHAGAYRYKARMIKEIRAHVFKSHIKYIATVSKNGKTLVANGMTVI